MHKAEAQLAENATYTARASWVQENFITEDTEASPPTCRIRHATTELVDEAKRFEGLNLPPDLARKFKLLKLSLTAPAPQDPKLRREMTQIAASLEGDYGKGKYCPKPDGCLDITAIEERMAHSTDPEELKDLWVGWHKVGAPMRQRYARFVELSNKVRVKSALKTQALVASNYDMPPERLAADLERLWNQVRPLYLSLHTYVRARLVEKYGPQVVPPDGPIPAHLLGNLWSQQWGNIYPVLGP